MPTRLHNCNLETMAQKQYKAINLATQASTHTKPWNPECLFTVDDHSHSHKLAKFSGGFAWHSHPNTDETFLVVSVGPIKIKLHTSARSPEAAEREGSTEAVEIRQGEIFCVPRGMQHRPSAEVEAGVLMVERVGTVNTGDRLGSEMRVVVEESGR